MTQPSPSPDRADRFQAVLADYLCQLDQGDNPDRKALLAAHPDLADDLAGYFEVQDRMERLAATNHGAHPTFGGKGTPSHPVLNDNGDALPEGSLLGQYRLESVIGEGAMGRIYRAKHLHLDRILAIKVLSPNLARDAQLVQRFQREARALAKLVHANIVAIHDMGSQGDVHYFVMEFVPGVNLRQLMARETIAPDQALAVVGKVCDALHFAHDQGIVHRDIKPENILIDSNGEPRVVDFGLAKVLRDEHPSANLTGTNVVLGTYNYMAPEQKSSARVDHRADIYALGVVLYELLTGKLPAGHFDPPSHAAKVTAGVDKLVLKALHNEPDRRYQSASDLGTDIASVRRGGPGPKPTPAVAAAGAVAGAAADFPRAVRDPQPYRFTGTRSITVVDSKTDQALGQKEAAWVRICLETDEDLEIRTWSRPEIGISTDGKIKKVKLTSVEAQSSNWTGTEADSLTGLEIQLPKHEATVHLPEDLPVRISGVEVNATVSSLRAPLRFDPGSGIAKVRDHAGRLELERTEGGSVSINGLVSDDFIVNTRKGRVVLNGLRMSSGRGKLHSDSGSIDIGVAETSCSFRYDVRTLSGALTCNLDSVDPVLGQSFMEGVVGMGDGQLEADSFEGDIRLGHRGRTEWEFDLSEAAQKMFWPAVFIGGAALFGHESIAWVLFWCWGLWALWAFVETLMKAKPWSPSRIGSTHSDHNQS